MITVSNSFKKAIKDTNRRIFGYVDVKYQDNDYNTSVEQIPSVLSVVSDNGILAGSKTMQKYATLEHNYTLLDGSFMVWNENVVDDKGYISNETFENIADKTIVIENSSTTTPVKGITIYFKENLPFSFTISVTDTNDDTITENVTNNDKMAYQYIFSNEMYVSRVEIIVSQIEFPQNRLRIAYIDFNVSDIYEGDELVKFDVIEELDLLLENLPINNCSINLNNYPSSSGGNKFDPINPKGIVEYLKDDVTLEPYIGILTEENGIEYVPMGVFYLSDWSSDTDGNVTLNGKSVLNKLKDIDIKPTSRFFEGPLYINDFKNFISNTINIGLNFISYSDVFNNSFIKNTELFQYLMHIVPIFLYYKNNSTQEEEYRKFYVNRNNQITINKIVNNNVDSINRSELLKDVSYVANNRIKELSLSYSGLGILEYTTPFDMAGASHTLVTNEDYVWFLYNNVLSPSDFSYTVNSGSGRATLVGYTYFMYCVKFTGTIGSRITINMKSGIKSSSTVNRTYTIVDDNVDYGDTLRIDEKDYYPIDKEYAKKIYFGLNKPYKVTAQTIGDPSLEIGDTIAIQTRYTDINDGYKNIIITKQHFSFDGGLQCDIDGLGD